jgi:ATP-dependent helicase HrpB
VLAAAITLAEIEGRFAGKIEDREAIAFDAASASLRARRSRRLGALALAEQTKQVAPDAATARILAQGIVGLGLEKLPWSKAVLQLRNRVLFLRRAEGEEWPDLSNEGLARSAADWLEPLLADKTARSEISPEALSDAVTALIPWNLRRRLDAEAPTHFTAPSGSNVPIDYDAEEGPKLSIRVQELFGLGKHPAIAGGQVPLVIELLSPAQRPVQVTRDLPGFWRGSYADVKADMRGRYPRHPWPDDPLVAQPTRRAKRRGE